MGPLPPARPPLKVRGGGGCYEASGAGEAGQCLAILLRRLIGNLRREFRSGRFLVPMD